MNVKAILFIVFVSLLVGNRAGAEPSSIIGYAYDTRNGTLFYTESYHNQYDEKGLLKSSRVLYQSADNSTRLAEKTLHYKKHSYAPELSFINFAADYEESIKWLAADTVVIGKREPGDKMVQRQLKVTEPVVADAGFDLFLKDHMDTLLSGKNLEFNFLNPARLDWFRFCAQAVEQSPSTITLRVYPGNSLLRWLLDPILLTYELPNSPHQQPRLLYYNGLTNMSLSGERPLEANIFYEYEQAPPQQIVNLF